MKTIGLTMLVFLKILQVENRMVPNYGTVDPTLELGSEIHLDSDSVENDNEKLIGVKTYDEKHEEHKNSSRKCAIVVLSSVQNPSMQSLLRRYRYNSNGILIPSSIKYFAKLSQGLKDTPLLVPLNDKTFSPSGGFIRFYKEVPPIPHSW